MERKEVTQYDNCSSDAHNHNHVVRKTEDNLATRGQTDKLRDYELPGKGVSNAHVESTV